MAGSGLAENSGRRGWPPRLRQPPRERPGRTKRQRIAEQFAFSFGRPFRLWLLSHKSGLVHGKELAVAVPAAVREDFRGKSRFNDVERPGMRQTDGTIHSTGGFPRITGSHPATKLRLAGLLLTVLLGSILTSWVSRTTWQRL